jgi:hypothetical protein
MNKTVGERGIYMRVTVFERARLRSAAFPALVSWIE